jgi:hypothetical protein
MRYTPFLDHMGISLKETVPDNIANILDSALAYISGTIDWGEYEGKRRKPCPEQPLLLTGQPIGQYHCPVCSEMQMASMPHMAPDENYEQLTGQPWPAGYEEKERVA